MLKAVMFWFAVTLCLSVVSMGREVPNILLYGSSEMAAYETHEGSRENGQLPSKVCFTVEKETQPRCFEARADNQVYFESPEVSFVAFPAHSASKIAIFSARQNFDGSGTATFLTALGSDPATSAIVNLLPSIVLSKQGDHRIWFDERISRFPIISTGEITAEPDSTVEGKHKYEVKSFVFDESAQHYRLADKYITGRAYGVFGSPRKLSVLVLEDARIKSRLHKGPDKTSKQ